MSQITLITHASPENIIPGLKHGDAKNAPLTFRPGVETVDLVGLTWIFTDYYPLHLDHPERGCNVIE